MTCLFCGIATRGIPSNILYEDDHVLAFTDIQPVAPIHVLVIPKKHIAGVGEGKPGDAQLLGEILLAGARVARELHVEASGYRLVINNGRDGGQHVAHLHLHVLAGRVMNWPPG